MYTYGLGVCNGFCSYLLFSELPCPQMTSMMYGQAYTMSTVGFGRSKEKGYRDGSFDEGNLRAPTFVERPESLVSVGRGEEIRLSCVVQGEPTPRVTWYRGPHDIAARGRAHETVRENRHTILMRDAEFTDSGTYTVEVKNSQGTTRAYCSIKVRETYKSRSESPYSSGIRTPSSETDIEIRRRASGRYIRDVPGKVGVPRATDVGKNWVSLAWTKPEHAGGAPVTAYKVEAWILGEEARWQELGVTPITSFDAYHMKTDREYLFRVTPRNKYGWGEAAMTPRPTRIGRKVEAPSMPKCLPSQVRCMPGGTVVLEGQVAGDPTPDVKWYKDGTYLDAGRYPRFRTTFSDANICMCT
ncbi:Titin-like protein [Armadillidium nasatum]|uniref:Titin-like protein n=1 Tax=Armadillidium nasatum TaxID=96803 RepID=A0A5N5TMF5_9CRUS|nr:Titin-like protein [Armadillidium nasatum]